jgi:uroporphyrinogen decarboxylase
MVQCEFLPRFNRTWVGRRSLLRVANNQLQESIFLRALRGERSPRVPIWLMRQAGRYLPEYRAIRANHSMLEMVRDPELATEVTLQPIRRYGCDAAIIFADILTPLIGMGANLEFKQGEGPMIDNPVRSTVDVDALSVPEPEENVGYTLEAIRMVSAELTPQGVPLIGFSGAPFTLSAYLIEGGSPGDLLQTKRFMWNESESFHHLQGKLVKLVADYLVAQAHAGAAALQIFDSWLGVLSPADYDTYVEPYLLDILRSVRSRTDVPVIFFATSVTGLFPQLAKLPVDAFGVDWRVGLTAAAKMIGRPLPLQGNLDPLILQAPQVTLRLAVRRVLEEGRTLPAHIFNLGHGINLHTPPESVAALVDEVRAFGSA